MVFQSLIQFPSSPEGIQVLLDKVKKELRKRGARGIVGFSRKFKSMDGDGSGGLSLGEFKQGLDEMGLGLQTSEVRFLFEFFDRNHDGTVSLEEFLTAIRGQLSDFRLKLVRQAFSALDVNKDGLLQPQELITRYDAANHPDVLAGRRTSDDVMMEFLEGIDVGGQTEGVVTRDELVSYFENLSGAIDSDDYFELVSLLQS